MICRLSSVDCNHDGGGGGEQVDLGCGLGQKASSIIARGLVRLLRLVLVTLWPKAWPDRLSAVGTAT